MSNLRFDYYMQIDYSVEVSKCNFTIKCIPQTNARQHIKNVQIELSPEVSYSRGRDGFGNLQIYGKNDIPHTHFSFHIFGDVATGLSDYEEYENDNLTMLFRHPHGLNVPGPKLREYFDLLTQKIHPCTAMTVAGKSRMTAIEIMNCLHDDFAYKPLVTTVDTSAEEAFMLGQGVCQDYAHIFISLLHMFGIPARYVTGMIIGEGASHAWVEIWDNGKWYGLDPTNNKAVCDEHIKIGVGRDAHDCMINRGIMHGGGLHTQDIKVTVDKVKNIF